MHIEYKDNGDNREYKLLDINRVVEEITIQRAPDKYREYQSDFDYLAKKCLIDKAIYDETMDPVTELCQHMSFRETNNA